MLVSVNDLLASGEVPELFAPEERDEIVNAMRGETKALGLVDTAENCWATFIAKVCFAPKLLPLLNRSIVFWGWPQRRCCRAQSGPYAGEGDLVAL